MRMNDQVLANLYDMGVLYFIFNVDYVALFSGSSIA